MQAPRISVAFVMLVLALTACASVAPARALDYATDPMRGYALDGRDPVAYFTEHRAVAGNEKLYYSWRGTNWLFRNEGNQAAFVKAPHVYAPAFTGCDPHALAQGFAVDGNPGIFALFDGRLLIFHSDINRFLFLADPDESWRVAEDKAERLGCIP
ncbi:YHS domain-containing (seleno)protein [Stappia sp.]|uniref:YHS domain-containing (seleno)protein n=1 Tax=Stappia sp. TaxID=1870903 RepID=UPI003A990E15